MNARTVFRPAWYLRPTTVQCILASSPWRTRKAGFVREASTEKMIAVAGGTRLMGKYLAGRGPRKGMVILIHGWEGGSESAYIQSAAAHLHSHGYSVFRLNLRDHGETHHLNEGLFFATLLNETHRAVQRAAAMAEGPVFLAGFSLGGNFALRIGVKCAGDPIVNLRHIVAVSPVLDPDKATTAVDAHFLFRRYFIQKWHRSLKRKQELYPRRYDFSHALSLSTIREMTDVLIPQYSDHACTADYFRHYTLTGDALQGLALPTTILTAADDPIIPVGDFRGLSLNGRTRLIVHSRGGHSGFIENLAFDGWHERYMVERFMG